MQFLEWALEGESYADAVSRYADVIISCGSALFGVNKLLKFENHARSVAVLDPGPLNRRKFDIVIIPRHDIKVEDPKAKNITVTDLAPNLIDPGELASFRKGAPEVKTGVCIGLLLGGDNPYFHFSGELARSLVFAIRETCERLDGYLYMTTSRRTPDEAENLIKEAFSDDPRCVKFVSGKDDTDEHTVEKILAVSDMVIVSGESISMVSEAVASGKPVLVFMPDKKTDYFTKYESFAEGLEKKKYLKVVSPEQIPAQAESFIRGKEEHALPDDNARMREKMYKLF
jgi:mitochondrial fission protein ELM1